MDKPLVSVVVPTYNSSSTLEPCLTSLELQTYPNVETIIVDNYSEDNTVNIAKKYHSRVFQVRTLRSAARNYGAEKGAGDFLLFVDADMELTPTVIEKCVKELIENNADAVMIPEVRVGEGFWAKCRAVERRTYIGDPLIESARFFKKRIFEDVGGFDEELEAGEDWDLHARVERRGYKIGKVNSLIKHQEGKLTIRDLARKKRYYGRTLTRYISKNPERARIQFMPIRLDYLKHWRLLAKYPLYACGMLLMKAVEYVAVGISILTHLGEGVN